MKKQLFNDLKIFENDMLSSHQKARSMIPSMIPYMTKNLSHIYLNN